ncbi:MAG: AraC family transcriptional regulator [Pseudomonadota bacterium]
MTKKHAQYQELNYNAKDIARFDGAAESEQCIHKKSSQSADSRQGNIVGGDGALVKALIREHIVIPGLKVTLMDGEILRDYETELVLPPGLTLFIGFRANGETRIGKSKLPHQTLPRIIYVYSQKTLMATQCAQIGPYQTLSIHFENDAFFTMLESQCLDDKEREDIIRGLLSNEPCHYWKAEAEVIESLHSLIYTELTGINLSLFVNQSIMGLLRSFFVSICATSNRHDRPLRPLKSSDIKKIEKVARYVQRNLDGKLTHDKIARKMGLGNQYLKTQFPRLYGESLADFVLKTRMNSARVMLASGGMTIQQVADKVGYASQASFTTAFRKFHTITPREALNSNQNWRIHH